jgi:mycofactocin biosynthesis protein MftB
VTPTSFDPGLRWSLHDSVAVRPEPFGALLYHFGTRRLTFVKDPTLLAVVRGLSEHRSALEACHAASVSAADEATYTAALARLAQTHMLVTAEAGS